ncbi:MAG: GDSL-type esterase/lipase family protein [Thermodesulfobacteriota bacterium]
MTPHAHVASAPSCPVRVSRGRLRRALGALGIGLASFVATTFAVEALLVRQGFLFEPMRSRANADEMLTRAEFSVHVQTNALGFRESRLPAPPAPGTLRIVAIGDSFTQGYGVGADEGYTHRLETLLEDRSGRDVEVINLGVPGANPIDYLHHLRQVGLDYRPDVVLVGIMANDVNDLRSVERFGARGVMGVLRDVRTEALDDRPVWKRLPHQLWPALYDLAATSVKRVRSNEAGAGARPGVPHPSDTEDVLPATRWREVLLELAGRYGRRDAVEAELARMPAGDRAALRAVVTGAWHFEDEVDQTPLWTLLSLIEPRVYVDSVLLPPAYDGTWRAMTGILAEIADDARAAGALPAFVFIPAAQQVVPEVRRFLERSGFAWDPRLLTDTTFADRLRGFGDAHGVPVIDLLEPLRRARARERLYYLEDGHWTPAGHAVAAEVIAARVPLP